MEEPPRNLSEHILNRSTSLEVILLGTLIGALAFANFALFMSRTGVTLSVDSTPWPLYGRATAITYLTIAFCQFGNILSRRDERRSLFSRNFWTNRILLVSIVVSAGFLVLGIYGPYISDFLSFAALTMTDWLYVLGAGLAYLVVFEIMKLLKRVRSA